MRILIGDSGEGIKRCHEDKTLRRGPVIRRIGDVASSIEEEDLPSVCHDGGGGIKRRYD